MFKERLYALKDEKNALFQAKLTPGIENERFLGVRVPDVRKLAKDIYKNEDYKPFLNELPHDLYDENMLHALIISEEKDYNSCIEYLKEFLPYVDNWAVCDICSPKVFKKHKSELIEKIREWTKSTHTYTCRFGMEMLMSHYLDEDFKKEYLDIVAAVKSDEYYVNMMIAWFFATALAKKWDETIIYLKENRLDIWAHNKTIQKAIESYRISDDQKMMLRKMKRK